MVRSQCALLQRHAVPHPPRPRRHRALRRRTLRRASALRGSDAASPVECLITRQARRRRGRGRGRHGRLVHVKAAAPRLRCLVTTRPLLGRPTKPHACLQRVRVATRERNLRCGDRRGGGAGGGAGGAEGGLGILVRFRFRFRVRINLLGLGLLGLGFGLTSGPSADPVSSPTAGVIPKSCDATQEVRCCCGCGGLLGSTPKTLLLACTLCIALLRDSRRAFRPSRAAWSRRRCRRKCAKSSVSMLRPEQVKMRM